MHVCVGGGARWEGQPWRQGLTAGRRPARRGESSATATATATATAREVEEGRRDGVSGQAGAGAAWAARRGRRRRGRRVGGGDGVEAGGDLLCEVVVESREKLNFFF